MKNLKFLLVGMLFISLISCSKDEQNPIVNREQSKTTYICGSEIQNGMNVPKIWINGIPFNLENNDRVGSATSIVVNGNDVYSVGYLWDANGLDLSAVVWKNYSIISVLTNKATQFTPYKIALIDNDVYVSGNEFLSTGGIIAKVWKNGVATNISNTIGAMPFSIVTYNNDIYVAGCLPSPFNSAIDNAVIWKNGIPSLLTDGSKNAVAKAVAVVGNDIYVAGLESNGTNMVAKFWKNGVETILSGGSTDTNINGIFVIENNVYIGGTVNGNSIIWKNGIPEYAYSTYFTSNFGSFSILDETIYALENGLNFSKLYINRVEKNMTFNSTYNSIFVK